MDVWHYIENKTVYKPNRIPHIFSSYSVEEVDHRNKPIIYACATVILVFFLLEAPKLPSAVLTAFFHRIWTLTLMWLGSFRKVQPVQRLFRKKYMCMHDNPSTDTLKRGLIPLLGYFPHGPFRTFLRVKKKRVPCVTKTKYHYLYFFSFRDYSLCKKLRNLWKCCAWLLRQKRWDFFYSNSVCTKKSLFLVTGL